MNRLLLFEGFLALLASISMVAQCQYHQPQTAAVKSSQRITARFTQSVYEFRVLDQDEASKSSGGSSSSSLIVGKLDLVRVVDNRDATASRIFTQPSGVNVKSSSSSSSSLPSSLAEEFEVVLSASGSASGREQSRYLSGFRIDSRTFELQTLSANFLRNSKFDKFRLRALLVHRNRPGDILDSCLIIVRLLTSLNRQPKFKLNPYEVNPSIFKHRIYPK